MLLCECVSVCCVLMCVDKQKKERVGFCDYQAFFKYDLGVFVNVCWWMGDDISFCSLHFFFFLFCSTQCIFVHSFLF